MAGEELELTLADIHQHECIIQPHSATENLQMSNRFCRTFRGFKKTKICEVCQKQKLNKTCLD